MSTLTLTDIRLSVDGWLLLDDVSEDLQPGTCVGITGRNGAGKTTLIDVVTGFVKPSKGHVIFQGESLSGLPPSRRASRGLLRTFQTPRVFPSLTVRSNLTLHPKNEPKDEIFKYKERLDLKLSLDSLAEMSQGQKRLIEILRALGRAPGALLLDEPFAALEDSAATELARILSEVKNRGCAMVVVDHRLKFLRIVADRFLVLDSGKLRTQKIGGSIYV